MSRSKRYVPIGELTPQQSRERYVDLTRCTLQSSGHGVHWIQALRTANVPEVMALSWMGLLVAVDGLLLTIRKPDGSTVQFRNHAPAGLAAFLPRPLAVEVNDRYCIMRAGGGLYSIRPVEEPWTPCERPAPFQPVLQP